MKEAADRSSTVPGATHPTSTIRNAQQHRCMIRLGRAGAGSFLPRVLAAVPLSRDLSELQGRVLAWLVALLAWAGEPVFPGSGRFPRAHRSRQQKAVMAAKSSGARGNMVWVISWNASQAAAKPSHTTSAIGAGIFPRALVLRCRGIATRLATRAMTAVATGASPLRLNARVKGNSSSMQGGSRKISYSASRTVIRVFR